jgi:tungstate transport system ATP-binding protein
MSEAIFQISDLVMSYDGRQVLHVAALQIRRGEIFALVGPSGAGKSTLLRLLNFLELPTRGAIHFAGKRYDRDRQPDLETRRRITTVFQRPLLLNRSVLANIRFGLRLRGRRDERERIDNVLDEVGLAALADQRARSLSGGEAQRVALARAMILEPEVLLLDEPTANLDPHNVALIEEIIRRRNAQQHTSCVLVTHNIFQARRLAHRVGLLLDGKLVEVADADAFFGDPTDDRTRAFVAGDMVY